MQILKLIVKSATTFVTKNGRASLNSQIILSFIAQNVVGDEEPNSELENYQRLRN